MWFPNLESGVDSMICALVHILSGYSADYSAPHYILLNLNMQ